MSKSRTNKSSLHSSTYHHLGSLNLVPPQTFRIVHFLRSSIPFTEPLFFNREKVYPFGRLGRVGELRELYSRRKRSLRLVITSVSATPALQLVPEAMSMRGDHWPLAQRWNLLPPTQFQVPSSVQAPVFEPSELPSSGVGAGVVPLPGAAVSAGAEDVTSVVGAEPVPVPVGAAPVGGRLK